MSLKLNFKLCCSKNKKNTKKTTKQPLCTNDREVPFFMSAPHSHYILFPTIDGLFSNDYTGHCMTLDSTEHACSSNSYAVHCNEPIFDRPFSAATCRCYDPASNSSDQASTTEMYVEATTSYDGSEANSTNVTVDSVRNDWINETCESKFWNSTRAVLFFRCNDLVDQSFAFCL